MFRQPVEGILELPQHKSETKENNKYIYLYKKSVLNSNF